MSDNQQSLESFGITLDAVAALRRAGYRIAPECPTQKMIDGAWPCEDAARVWSDMLALAPHCLFVLPVTRTREA